MKIIAISSVGGHWIQLLRLKPFFDRHDTIFVSTRADFSGTVSGSQFYSISDFNRNNMKGVWFAIRDLIKILRKEKPDAVITTGAAPGLLALLIAKVFGVKTIWLDSIANVEELSMSGRIASIFALKPIRNGPIWLKERLFTQEMYYHDICNYGYPGTF